MANDFPLNRLLHEGTASSACSLFEEPYARLLRVDVHAHERGPGGLS